MPLLITDGEHNAVKKPFEKFIKILRTRHYLLDIVKTEPRTEY